MQVTFFFPHLLLPHIVPACFTSEMRFPLEVRCQFDLHSEAFTKRCLECLGRELPLSIFPCLRGIHVKNCWFLNALRKGRGIGSWKSFLSPGDPWGILLALLTTLWWVQMHLALHFLELGLTYHLCLKQWRCMFSCTPSDSHNPVVVVDSWPPVVWSRVVEDSVCVCVCRSSRLENERFRGSNSFLKVWEYRPEKGREIFLKLYQCFTRTRIADRVYWEERSEDQCGHVAKGWCCNNHHCLLVKQILPASA